MLATDQVEISVLDSVLQVSATFLTAITEAAYLVNVIDEEYVGVIY